MAALNANKTPMFDEILAESNRAKQISKLANLVKHVSIQIELNNDGSKKMSACAQSSCCHDMDTLFTWFADNLVRLVADHLDDQFEQVLAQLPVKHLLFPIADGFPVKPLLSSTVFIHFYTEYIQILPQKSEKFIVQFAQLLRGSDQDESSSISIHEQAFFIEFRTSVIKLIQNSSNVQKYFVSSLMKRYPFVHNSSLHEFACYVHNYIQFIVGLASVDQGDESAHKLYDELVNKLIQMDLWSFFDDVYKEKFQGDDEQDSDDEEDKSLMFQMDCDEVQAEHRKGTSPHHFYSTFKGEKLKKILILDQIYKEMFSFIDTILESPTEQTFLLELVMSTFLNRQLSSSFTMHLQYVVFYLASKSSQFCDALVRELWSIVTNTVLVDGDTATVANYSLIIRCHALFHLTSLLLQANWIPFTTVFTLFKALLDWMNAFLYNCASNNPVQSGESDNHFVYYQATACFARLFIVHHSEMDRVHIECLKHLGMKRCLLDGPPCGDDFAFTSPLSTFNDRYLVSQFLSLANYYRIGYVNAAEINLRPLCLRANATQKPPPVSERDGSEFGTIFLRQVHDRVVNLVRDKSSLCFNATINRAGAEMFNRLDSSTGAESCKSMFMAASALATSPDLNNTTTSGDDTAMLSSSGASSSFNRPSSLANNAILSRMLSDSDGP